VASTNNNPPHTHTQRPTARAQTLAQVLAILTLCDAANAALPSFLSAFAAACAAGAPGDAAAAASAAASAALAAPGAGTLAYARSKAQRFTPLHANGCGPLLPLLEAVKSADLLIVLLPASSLTGADADAVSPAAIPALACLRALGLPPAMGAVLEDAGAGGPAAMEGLPAAAKAAHRARLALRRRGEDIMAAALGVSEPRCAPSDPGQSAAEFVRQLSEMRLAPPVWRTLRPYVLAESARYEPGPAGPDGAPGPGTLVVSGHVRGGPPLSANQLAYLPGIGEFQFERIDAAPAAGGRRGGGGDVMEADGGAGGGGGGGGVLSVPDAEARESLQRYNVADVMANEQTWPTDAEMEEAAAEGGARAARRKLLRRPRGWSDYQAAWIPEAEEEEEDEPESAEEMGDAEADEEAEEDAAAEEEEEEEEEDGWLGEEEVTQEQALEAARHDSERRLALRRAADAVALQEDDDFPDEVDVPLDSAAAVRFARYRGLKSFRASPWDPYESLPASYARLFAFQSFARTRRRALAAAAAARGAAPHGARVEARLAGVPPAAAAAALRRAPEEGCALVLLGLLAHEAKLSVLHCGVSKALAYAPPLRSKASLELHAGFRRIGPACTLFSGDGTGDKHKLERFLRPRAPAVATLFGPITYGPAPALLFDPASGQLAASGTLRPCAPERVILKRAVITGFPAKVNKRKAIVRFMFHGPEDVRYFKPLELWTKDGRHGKIREPVGTHGSMKVAFDGVVQQRDTVCASLYKRVFPKMTAEAEAEAAAEAAALAAAGGGQ